MNKKWPCSQCDKVFLHRPNLIRHQSTHEAKLWTCHIPLPIKLRSKHAIVNVQNRDKKCFMWSMLAALHPTDRNAERISKYIAYTNELNFEYITFPVKVKDIHKF